MRATILGLIIAVGLGIGTTANAEELLGKSATDLVAKADILFSRIALSSGGREKLVEIVLHHRGNIWICELWVEGGPVAMAKILGDLGDEVPDQLKGRSNAECHEFIPSIVN